MTTVVRPGVQPGVRPGAGVHVSSRTVGLEQYYTNDALAEGRAEKM